MIRGIDRILLRVPSLQSAVRYYHDALGLKVLRQDNRLAALKLGEDGSELILHSDDDLPTDTVFYRVDDVKDLYNRRDELNLHFVSSPQPTARGFRASIKDPFGNLLLILDRTRESASTIEDATMPVALFPGAVTRVEPQRDLLIELYEKIGRTADDLPYTPHFETLYSQYIAKQNDPKPSRNEVWRHLLNLRKKKGMLPRLGPAKSAVPDVSGELKQKLRVMLGEAIGRRDRLPYTQQFESLADDFNKLLPKPISPHQLWRLVATLAK